MNRRYLVLDSESPYDGIIFDFSYSILDQACEVVEKVASRIINPTLSDVGVSEKYKLSIREGRRKPWKGVYEAFLNDIYSLEEGGKIIAHHLAFDVGKIKKTCEANHIPKPLIDAFLRQIGKKGFCSMKRSAPLTKLQTEVFPNGKYPSLTELYKYLYGADILQLHTAESDVHLLVLCIKKLRYLIQIA